MVDWAPVKRSPGVGLYRNLVACRLGWGVTDAPIVVLWAMMPLGVPKLTLLESIAVLVLASIIGIVAYSPLIGTDLISNDLNVRLPYRGLLGFLILLPLMWAVLRGQRANVATAALIVSGITAWGFSAFDQRLGAAACFGRSSSNTPKLICFLLRIS